MSQEYILWNQKRNEILLSCVKRDEFELENLKWEIWISNGLDNFNLIIKIRSIRHPDNIRIIFAFYVPLITFTQLLLASTPSFFIPGKGNSPLWLSMDAMESFMNGARDSVLISQLLTRTTSTCTILSYRTWHHQQVWLLIANVKIV